MPTRKTYHVVPSPKGGWNVEAEKASRPSSRHGTKDEVVTRARELAKQQNLGQVVIHKKDGTIQEERTYGKDPEGTPG